jgi:hypothetical protein
VTLADLIQFDPSFQTELPRLRTRCILELAQYSAAFGAFRDWHAKSSALPRGEMLTMSRQFYTTLSEIRARLLGTGAELRGLPQVAKETFKDELSRLAAAEHELRRTLAFTPDELDAGARSFAEGKGRPLTELRDELRHRIQP